MPCRTRRVGVPGRRGSKKSRSRKSSSGVLQRSRRQGRGRGRRKNDPHVLWSMGPEQNQAGWKGAVPSISTSAEIGSGADAPADAVRAQKLPVDVLAGQGGIEAAADLVLLHEHLVEAQRPGIERGRGGG